MNLFARLLLALALLTGAGSSVVPRPAALACDCCDEPMDQCPCGPATPAPASHRIPCNAPVTVLALAAETSGLEAVSESHREAKPLDGLPPVPMACAPVAKANLPRVAARPTWDATSPS